MSRNAGCIVFRRLNGIVEYLVIFKKDLKFWEFPKGRVDAGESDLNAMKRELLEETGIKDFKLFPAFRHSFFITPAPNVTREVINYLIEVSPETKVNLSEHSEFKWVSFEDAKKSFSFDNLKELIDKGKAFIEKN